ncbi:MAG: effector binding domain-containing protein [Clostridium argentinense]|uniref:Effector binding domain-containing protein n=1 Tax=Clostridium faecium TaxID=2762223 RepID=A0ABR8YQJ4_9CLOT|nr:MULTISPECIES: GyrI-like domain-containing protein [Clostridium]MBD8046513.1 effector binding domain-containing protein [Clostridium faecium]MBS5823014.1 effector binding domain-containing protein [Clostridium argentinense]
MNYEIVNLQEKIIAGIGVKTTNKDMKAMADIGRLWEEFIGKKIIDSIPMKVNEKAIGLYTEYEGNYTKPYKFYCAVEVSDAIEDNDDIITKVIPSGKYAKFTVKGNVQKAVGEAWEKIWNMDLDRKYSCDFEVYHNDSEDINNQTIDIYISLN